MLHVFCFISKIPNLFRFLSFQIDVEAVAHASDNELLLLGVYRRFVLSLRSFSERMINESKGEEKLSEKKLLLRSILEKGKSNRTLKANSTGRNVDTGLGKRPRKVQNGWLHYDEGKQSFVSVRSKKGGGSREIELPLGQPV